MSVLQKRGSHPHRLRGDLRKKCLPQHISYRKSQIKSQKAILQYRKLQGVHFISSLVTEILTKYHRGSVKRPSAFMLGWVRKKETVSVTLF